MQVFAYVTNHISHTSTFDSIVSALSNFGIRVSLDKMMDRYQKNVDTHRDIMTWGVKLPLSWYESRNKNILFLENGLLRQSAAMTCDHAGLYDNSVVSKDTSEPSDEEVESLEQKVIDRFGVDLFSEYDESGPILIAMQRVGDAPVKHHFVDDPIFDSWELFIKICSEHLRDKDVIIRNHPRDNPNSVHNSIKRFMPSNWSFVGSKGNIYDRIPSCRAMVSINSTVATEALIYSMPVATIGRGAFTNHGATLECSGDHSLLAGIDDFRPNLDKISRYLCSVCRYELSYKADVDTVMKHHSFKKWFDKVKEGFKDCIPDTITPKRNKRVNKDKFADKIKRTKKSI